jgi:hypothetical protein
MNVTKCSLERDGFVVLEGKLRQSTVEALIDDITKSLNKQSRGGQEFEIC